MTTTTVRELALPDGKLPFARWFDKLDAAAKVATAVYRLGEGHFSNTKGVGSGVFETRFDFGPGYRVHFGKDGPLLVILPGGSAKRDQQHAISSAVANWKTYKSLERARDALIRRQRWHSPETSRKRSWRVRSAT